MMMMLQSLLYWGINCDFYTFLCRTIKLYIHYMQATTLIFFIFFYISFDIFYIIFFYITLTFFWYFCYMFYYEVRYSLASRFSTLLRHGILLAPLRSAMSPPGSRGRRCCLRQLKKGITLLSFTFDSRVFT